MDAVTLLKEDHQRVKGLFQQLEKLEDKRGRKMVLDQLIGELRAHERIEEEIFYPAVDMRAKEKKVSETIIESYVEHDWIDRIAKDLLGTEVDAEAWPAKLKVMKENVEHHAFEEEEKELFPKVQDMFSGDELDDLGAEMEMLKDDVKEEIEESSSA